MAGTYYGFRADRVPEASLYVSEPNPARFGNPENVRMPKMSGWSNSNWLKSRFHFSFAEHRGGRSQFGALRVLNDDLVQPKRGFGEHGHSNMEIATYVVAGELTHKDSMGTAESLGRGAIQYMSAGSGVRHSEFNHGDKPLRFIQMWFLPGSRGLTPNYGSFVGDAGARANRWHHMISDARRGGEGGADTPIKIHQDVDLSVAELDAGKDVMYNLKAGRMAYLLDMEGEVTVTAADATNSLELVRHDAADLFGPASLTLVAGGSGAHLLLVDMASTA